MESDSASGSSTGKATPPSTAQARAILATLGDDGSRLSTHLVTPWWYHVGLGLVVASFVISQTMPAPLAISLVVLGLVAIPVLTKSYTHRYGVSMSQPAGRRSRRLLWAMVGLLAVAMATALLVRSTGLSAWWGLVPAAFAFALTVVLGRRYDQELRNELARGVERA